VLQAGCVSLCYDVLRRVSTTQVAQMLASEPRRSTRRNHHTMTRQSGRHTNTTPALNIVSLLPVSFPLLSVVKVTPSSAAASLRADVDLAVWHSVSTLFGSCHHVVAVMTLFVRHPPQVRPGVRAAGAWQRWSSTWVEPIYARSAVAGGHGVGLAGRRPLQTSVLVCWCDVLLLPVV